MKFFSKYITRLNPRLFWMLTGFYSVFAIIHVLKNIYFLEKAGRDLSTVPFEVYFLDWIFVILFMSLIAINTKQLLKKNIAWKKIFLLHFFLSILINIGIRILVESYLVIRGIKSANQLTKEELLDGFIAFIDVNFLIYFAMLLIIYSFFYLEQIKTSETQKRNLETQLLGTKLKLLSSQMQPHFLFNTLNNITAMVKTDQDKAQETIVDLSDFLRETLELKDQNSIMVKNELQLLKNYLRIIKTRFSDHLKITQNIEPGALSIMMPPLVLQPILENSIKHGFGGLNKTLLINISIKSSPDWLEIEVTNNGVPVEEIDNIFQKGLGMSNLKERLENIYQAKYVFKIENLPSGSGVKTTLKLPTSFPIENQRD